MLDPADDKVYLIQHFVIKFASDLRWFSPGTQVTSTNKTDRHDITEILLKMALDSINITISLLVWSGRINVRFVYPLRNTGS